jgi:MFS family permease
MAKGTAMGVYNTSQSLGIFVGGALGGYLSHTYGFSSVFIFCGVMMVLWLLFASSMQAPLAVRTRMYTMDASADSMTAAEANVIRGRLLEYAGVVEAAVLPQERTVILKLDKSHDWDDAQVYQLLKG